MKEKYYYKIHYYGVSRVYEYEIFTQTNCLVVERQIHKILSVAHLSQNIGDLCRCNTTYLLMSFDHFRNDSFSILFQILKYYIIAPISVKTNFFRTVKILKLKLHILENTNTLCY